MAQVVERFNPGARVRQDLYGFGDILAVREAVLHPRDAAFLKGPMLLVQACTVGDQSRRLAKITSPPVAEKARVWLQAGGRIEVHGWALRGPRGKRKLWSLTCTTVTLADLARVTRTP
jgi:hypothetical protein